MSVSVLYKTPVASIPVIICEYAAIPVESSRNLATSSDPSSLPQRAIISFCVQEALRFYPFYEGRPLPREGEPVVVLSASIPSLHLLDRSEAPAKESALTCQVEPLDDVMHSIVARVARKIGIGIETPFLIELWPQINSLLFQVHREFPALPVKCVENVGARLGIGVEGPVYAINFFNKLHAIKFFIDPKNASALSKSLQSLEECYSYIKMLSQVPKHESVMAFNGLGYVKSLARWGLIFEKIEGETLEKWLREPKKITVLYQILIDIVEGLCHLDSNGWAHIDASGPSNFMVKSLEGRGVVIDNVYPFDSRPSGKTPAISLRSRRGFGRLFSSLSEESCRRIPVEVRLLMEKCASEISMEELGWTKLVQLLTDLRARTTIAGAGARTS